MGRAGWVAAAALVALGCGSGDGGGGGPAACTVQAGQCPNFCTHGIGVKDEACSTTVPCGCGLFCKAGSCAPYEAENAGCKCEAVAPPVPGEDVVTPPPPDTSGPGVDINNCPEPPPEGAECNPYCNLGCKEGKHCSSSGGDFACVTIGKKKLGEKCSGSKDCDVGMACFALTGDPSGNTCHKFCHEDQDCGDERKCDLNVNFDNGVSAKFCGDVTVGCNAFEIPSKTCSAEQGCYLANNATKCLPAGGLDEGKPCQAQGPSSCKPGLQCLVVCTKVCSIIDVSDDMPKCADTCSDFDKVDDGNGIGICVTDKVPAVCDLFKQTGCSGDEACFPVSGGIGCIKAGTAKMGQTCKYTNDCVGGTICVDQLCQEACDAHPDAAAEVSCAKCVNGSQVITPQAWGIGFCNAVPAETCDFWLQDCTKAGEFCYYAGSGATCFKNTKDGKEGDGCSTQAECGKGFMCASGGCLEPCSIAEVVPDGVPVCSNICPDGEFHPINIEAQIGACGK